MANKKKADGGQPSAGKTGTSLSGSAPHSTTNGTHDQLIQNPAEKAAQLAAAGFRTHEQLQAQQNDVFDSPVFPPLTFTELLDLPPKTWIVDQVIGAGDITMIYGAPGCGKTFVVIDLVLAACTGGQWAERFNVARPLNVAYCAGEGVSGLPVRFAAAAQRFGVTELNNFTFFKTIPQLYTEEATEIISITRFVREWQGRQMAGMAQPLDMLVVDTMHTATVAADENSAKDMGKVLHACRWAALELGCAIVLVHHTNKSGNAERGSSALRGAMDCMIEIRRISDTGTKAVMSCAKLKDGESWKDQTFDLVAMDESVRIWWDEPNDAMQSKGKEEEYRQTMLDFITGQPGVKLTAKVLADVAGIEQRHAIRLLSKMVSDGKCQSELMDTTKKNSNRNPLAYFVRA